MWNLDPKLSCPNPGSVRWRWCWCPVDRCPAASSELWQHRSGLHHWESAAFESWGWREKLKRQRRGRHRGREELVNTHRPKYPLYHCVPSEGSVRTRCSSSIHSVVSLWMSLKAFTGCPRKPSGSLLAAVERTSSLSAHLNADIGPHLSKLRVIYEQSERASPSQRATSRSR